MEPAAVTNTGSSLQRSRRKADNQPGNDVRRIGRGM